MFDADQLAFGAMFLKLRNVFNMRGDKADVRQAMEVYFRVLRRFPLGAVDAGATVWLARGTRFPKPAEWLDAIPKQRAAGIQPMPESDVLEYQRARALVWDDEPCSCQDCRQAEVTHRMLRYVPDTDAYDQDVRMSIGDKVVVRGHWAHGDELKRWYAARDNFLALKAQYGPRLMKAMPPVKIPVSELV